MRVSRNSVLLAGLIATAVAVPALAQQGGTTKYPECAANFTPSQAEQDAAHSLFLAGRQAEAEADYTKAIDLYKDAYKRDCTKHVLLAFIAKADELKGDKAEAINALETYLARVPKADDADQVRKHIENLKAQVGTQPTTTTTTATTTTATTTSTATAPTSTSTATTAPTSTETAPTGERSHTAAPWIVFGIGAGAAIAGAIMTGVGASQLSDVLSKCPQNSAGKLVCGPGVNQSDYESKDTSAHTLENVGIGVLIGGGALMIAGLIWHFAEPTGPKTTVTPVVGMGYGGFALQHRF